MKKIYFSDKMFYGGHMYTITSYPHNEAEACKVDMSDFLDWVRIFARQSKSYVYVDLGRRGKFCYDRGVQTS